MTDLSRFDISEFGFLPAKCVTTLPKNFECLQHALNQLPETISDKGIRLIINYLPKYDVNLHTTINLTIAECKFMYSILCMLMNRYVWCMGFGNAKKCNTIPQIIGIPLYEISQRLGIVPILTHAAVDLWNWKINGNEFKLDNLETINTMTGNISESWFYKIMIAIEGNGGKMLTEIYDISQMLNKNVNNIDNNVIADFLIRLSNNISDSNKLIKKMYDHCDAEFFFNNIRIYLSGSANEHLPYGLKIDLSPIGRGKYRFSYKGGSAAQSTLIQVYDRLLGVIHNDSSTFLNEMKDYMPISHRNFLDEIKSIKTFVDNSDDAIIINNYNKCVDQLQRFRQSHLGLVQNYIIPFLNRNENKNAHGEKGSAGTDLKTFLQEVIIETEKTKIKNDNINNNNTVNSNFK